MFVKLKRKLIAINMVLVSAVIIIGFLTAYMFTRQSIEQQSEIIMHGVAKNNETINDIKAGLKNYENPADKILDKIFYIKVTAIGDVIEYSNTDSYDQKTVNDLLKRAIEEERLNGYIKYGFFTFKYIKVEKIYGNIFVFFDTGMENDIFSRLLVSLAVIALISVIPIFFISTFLSGKAIKPVKVSWEKQNAFVADASHELRTPLSVVRSNLEIVMDNKAETVENQYKWLGNIDCEVSRMSKMVEDLMFLARSDMQKEEMVMDMFDISSSINQMTDVFKPLLDKKFISISREIEPHYIVMGNDSRIKQLITILIDNAMNYTPPGGSITVGLVKEDFFYEIFVRDTGEGIPKEEEKNIFERFYRIDKSRSRNTGGTGLGLSIAQIIVKEHKGSISVKSTPGTGSEFRIRLPYSQFLK